MAEKQNTEDNLYQLFDKLKEPSNTEPNNKEIIINKIKNK